MVKRATFDDGVLDEYEIEDLEDVPNHDPVYCGCRCGCIATVDYDGDICGMCRETCFGNR